MDFGRPRSPEPVRSGAFTYGRDGIKAGGISRESVSELRLLFRKNASTARVRAATKPWITAQLQLYGIPFKKSDSAVHLRATLETAVKAGKVSWVPHLVKLKLKLKLRVLTRSSAIISRHPSQRWRNPYRSSTNSG